MAPAIITTARNERELSESRGCPIDPADRPTGWILGPGAPTIYLDRKSLPR